MQRRPLIVVCLALFTGLVAWVPVFSQWSAMMLWILLRSSSNFLPSLFPLYVDVEIMRLGMIMLMVAPICFYVGARFERVYLAEKAEGKMSEKCDAKNA